MCTVGSITCIMVQQVVFSYLYVALDKYSFSVLHGQVQQANFLCCILNYSCLQRRTQSSIWLNCIRTIIICSKGVRLDKGILYAHFLILCPQIGSRVDDEISDHVNIYTVIYMVPKKDKSSKPNPFKKVNTISTGLQSKNII